MSSDSFIEKQIEKIIVCFVNRKYAKKILINRKRATIILNSSPNYNIFIKENLILAWVIPRKHIEKMV